MIKDKVRRLRGVLKSFTLVYLHFSIDVTISPSKQVTYYPENVGVYSVYSVKSV
jgi:hypothetical protein